MHRLRLVFVPRPSVFQPQARQLVKPTLSISLWKQAGKSPLRRNKKMTGEKQWLIGRSVILCWRSSTTPATTRPAAHGKRSNICNAMVRASRQFLQDCSSFVPRCGRWMDTSRASTRRPQACLGYRRAGHEQQQSSMHLLTHVGPED